MYCVLLCVIVDYKDPIPFAIGWESLFANHWTQVMMNLQGQRSYLRRSVPNPRALGYNTCQFVLTGELGQGWNSYVTSTSGTCDTCHLEGCGTKPDTQPDRTCHHTNQHPAFCPWDMRAMPSCCFSECQHHIHQRLQTSLRLFLMDKHWITELVLSDVLLLWIIPHHDKKHCNTGKAFGMVWPGFHSSGVPPMNA